MFSQMYTDPSKVPVVDTILRWPPSFPFSGTHIFYNPLPLREGETCEYVRILLP